MNLILLPGNSKRNKQWLEEVNATLAPLFGTTYQHDYLHWELDEPMIDIDAEAERLKEPALELHSYTLFAKSAGSVLALRAIAQGILQPTKCLFVGFPLEFIAEEGIAVKDLLPHITPPVVILQHTNDPAGSYDEVKQYFAKMNNVRVHELPGDTHDYLEFEEIKNAIKTLN